MNKTTLLLLLLTLGATPGLHAAKIQKCKDAEGRWHYGDTASEKCKQSQVIELTDKGAKTRVIDAPPTDEELADRERHREDLERQKKEAEEQARKDQLLLSTYGHENDIVYVRDRKLEQIDSSITASKETLQSLEATLKRLEQQAEHEQNRGKVSKDTQENIERNKAQIARHEGVIAAKRQEQEAIKQQHEDELKRYRELKARQASQAAP